MFYSRYTKHILAAVLLLSAFTACKKDNPTTQTNDNLSTTVLKDFSTNVASANYNDLYQKTGQLQQQVDAFVQSPDDSKLAACRQAWYQSRQAWEQSEGFLFGPVETENLDPAIDDWPVSKVDLDSVLNSSSTIDQAYIEHLPTTLKGFHAIEYLIFGSSGQKKTSEFTPREKNFLQQLTVNLATVTLQMKNAWDVNTSGSFGQQVMNAGTSGSQFSSQKDAYAELVNSMADIVEEVGSEKINTPFVQRDSNLEESHFSRNSFNDFANNIQGVKNAYMGVYSTQGTGMNQLVNSIDKSLDLKIQQQISNAISVLTQFKMPFGTAISQQPAAIQNAQEVLDQLHTTLDTDLRKFVQTNIKK